MMATSNRNKKISKEQIRPVIELAGVELDIPSDVMKMYNKLTPMQKKVACHCLTGMTNLEIHDAIYAHDKTKKNTCNKRKSQSIALIKKKVMPFILACDKVRLSAGIMTREEILANLSHYARTSLSDIFCLETGQIKEESTRHQHTAISSMTVGQKSVSYKTDRMEATKLLVDILGLKESEKIEVTANITQQITAEEVKAAKVSLSETFGVDLD
jgi:hypothetical protein